MAKELPYFRFTPQEWQNGDISLERFELRGFFMDLCSYYWINDCSIARVKLEKRYSNDIKMLNELLELGIITWNKETDFIHINFLNEQFDVLSEQRKRRQRAGSMGGKQKSSNAKASLKQKSSYKDKYKDKDKYKELEGGKPSSLTIKDRKEAFKNLMAEKIKGTDFEKNKDELNKFYSYWTEHGDSDKKMRFEKEKSFSIKRRLTTWFNNSYSGSTNKVQSVKTSDYYKPIGS